MKRKHRRRKFILKDSYQKKHLLTFVILAGVSIFFIPVLFVSLSTSGLSALCEDHILDLGNSAGNLKVRMLGVYWIYVLLGGALFAVLSVFITHKVAGPLYRLEASLDRMISCDIGFGVDLRKNDECKALVNRINQFNSMLCSRVKAMRRLSDQVDSSLVKIDAAAVELGRDKEMTEELSQALAFNRRLTNLLYEFNTDSDEG